MGMEGRLLCFVLMPLVSGNFNLVFVGNPGVGKSSLASSVTGAEFESGLSFGGGLTSELHWKEAKKMKGVQVADTPGLADVELKDKAAAAIGKALQDTARTGKGIRLVFVVTTEGGRIRPADLWTIHTVMAAIELPPSVKERKKNLYSVLINKCEFLTNKRFREGGGKTQVEMTFKDHPELKGFTTNSIAFVPMVKELQGEDNARAEFPNVKEFFYGGSRDQSSQG